MWEKGDKRSNPSENKELGREKKERFKSSRIGGNKDVTTMTGNVQRKKSFGTWGGVRGQERVNHRTVKRKGLE